MPPMHNSSSDQQICNSRPLQGIYQQPQFGEYNYSMYGESDAYRKKRLWNSYQDLGNIEYEEGALNLTTKQSNSTLGKLYPFNDGSTNSLNGVSYHEGYYEENPPTLSYSANWQSGIDNVIPPNVDMNHERHFNVNRQVFPGTEDSVYLEDAEWYQQWLSLLEQGMWWPAEDGDCGYFVYTDHEYIYALLTDAAGENVYVCAPEGEGWENPQKFDHFPSAWLYNEMVLVCGFKIPLYNEDELLWLPGQDHNNSQLLNAPLDLSAAYRKGNQIMNLNLEHFSEMFENSFAFQGPPISSYKLNKVRMDPKMPNYIPQDEDVIDLSFHREPKGPFWNNQDLKSFFAQKVAVSLNSTPTAISDQQVLYKCYQPCQRRRSSSGVAVKHVDDTSEEEWRSRVLPGEERPNRQVKNISSFISTFVSKPSEVELNKASTLSSRNEEKMAQNIFSSSFQSLKSKIIKEDCTANSQIKATQQQVQGQSTKQGRILPTAPTALSQTSTTFSKPRLLRQTTMAQQAAPPTLPQVTTTLQSKEVNKPAPSGQLPGGRTVEKPPEKPQTGFMSFLKTSVGIEETKPDSQPSPTPSKTSISTTLTETTDINKETGGVSNLFGSISSLFSTEPPSTQKPQLKPSVTEGSLALSSRPKGIQRQQTMDQSGTFRNAQSQPPNKSVSQIFPPSVNQAPTQSQTMPQIDHTKQDTTPKQSGGLFGFSIGEMLTGSTLSGSTPQTSTPGTASQEGSLGTSILSMFSGPNPPQAELKMMSQTPRPGGAPPPSQQEPLGKSLLSMFGGTAPPQPTPQTKSNDEAQQKTIPPKDPPRQTGSLLGGLLSGSSNLGESPVKGLFSVFSESSPSQPPTTSPQQQTLPQQTQSKPQTQSQAQDQTATSVLGGLLGGLSSSTESPRKSLFSMFISPSTPQTNVPPAKANNHTATATPVASLSEKGSTLNAAAITVKEQAIALQQESSLPSTSTKDVLVKTLTSQMPSELSGKDSNCLSTAATLENHTMKRDAENKITTQGPSPAIETASSGQPSLISGSGQKPSLSQDGLVPEVAGRSSLSLFTRPGTDPNTCQTGPSPTATTGASSDSMANGLLSALGGSNLQSSPQMGGSLLGRMFGGSSPQTAPPQTGGSLLGGLFGGPAPQAVSTKTGGLPPQTGESQTGPSLLGGLFGGSAPQATGSQTGGSILDGIFGGSTAPSSSTPQNSSSIFGGIFGGSQSQTSSAQSGSSLRGGMLPRSSASNEVTGKGNLSVFGGHTSPAQPTIPATVPAKPNGNNQSIPTSVSETTSNVTVLPKPATDIQRPAPAVPECSLDGSTVKSNELTETAQPQDSKANKKTMLKTDEMVDHLTSSEFVASTENKMPSKVEDPESPCTFVQQQPSEPDKSVLDSSADKVAGFVSSLFGPSPVPATGPQQQQARAAPGQSLLGGIFGGPSNQASTPQTGGSLLGGWFGSAPQSSPQTNTSSIGGSVLGGMFGGGSTAKPGGGTPSGGSLLGGIFGGSASNVSPQSGNSILGGMFGGVTAQTAGAQPATSILGGIGGSLFGGVGQQTKPPENPAPKTKSTPEPQQGTPRGTETTVNKIGSTVTEAAQVKSAPEIVNSETPTATSVLKTDPTQQIDDIEKETPAPLEEVIQDKPIIIKEDTEIKDKSILLEAQGTANQCSSNTEPTQTKSLLGLITTSSDAGKSFGSLFSPTTAPSHTEQGSGFFSGLKTLSGSLFHEEKTIAGKQEPSNTSFFATKIGFTWQTESTKPQASPVITSQPKTDEPTQSVEKTQSACVQKTDPVGSKDDVGQPHICICTPEVDPSASPSPNEKDNLVATYPNAGLTSGAQLDNQFKKELLNAKRLVKA